MSKILKNCQKTFETSRFFPLKLKYYIVVDISMYKKQFVYILLVRITLNGCCSLENSFPPLILEITKMHFLLSSREVLGFNFEARDSLP